MRTNREQDSLETTRSLQIAAKQLAKYKFFSGKENIPNLSSD